MAIIFDAFRRYWYVPVHTLNEKEVPETFEKLGINYTVKVLTDQETGRVDGHIYVFNCVPVLYTALKTAMKTGNGYRPLEIPVK